MKNVRKQRLIALALAIMSLAIAGTLEACGTSASSSSSSSSYPGLSVQCGSSACVQ